MQHVATPGRSLRTRLVAAVVGAAMLTTLAVSALAVTDAGPADHGVLAEGRTGTRWRSQ
jgi:hypothetical protein